MKRILSTKRAKIIIPIGLVAILAVSAALIINHARNGTPEPAGAVILSAEPPSEALPADTPNEAPSPEALPAGTPTEAPPSEPPAEPPSASPPPAQENVPVDNNGGLFTAADFTHQRTTEHFEFFYTDADMNAMDDVAKGLEEDYEWLTGLFHVELPNKVTAYIFPDIRSLNVHFGTVDASLWVVARADISMTRIGAVSPVYPQTTESAYYDYGNSLPALRHELVHIVQYAMKTKHHPPYYMVEGVASYIGGESYVIKYLPQSTGESLFPASFRDLRNRCLLANDIHSYEFSLYIYACGYAFVEFIVETYGYDKLVELFWSYETDFANNVAMVFGASEEEFYDMWIEYLNANYYADYYKSYEYLHYAAWEPKVAEPERVDTLSVAGKAYQAAYYGEFPFTGSGEYVCAAFWRLEDAYSDFRDIPVSGWMYSYNYPMVAETGQVYVVDLTKPDGTVERWYYRSDGHFYNGVPMTDRFGLG